MEVQDSSRTGKLIYPRRRSSTSCIVSSHRFSGLSTIRCLHADGPTDDEGFQALLAAGGNGSAAGEPFAYDQRALVPSNRPYHNGLHGQNANLGNAGGNGGQARGGDGMLVPMLPQNNGGSAHRGGPLLAGATPVLVKEIAMVIASLGTSC